MAGRRTSPVDGLNLNRTFPGDPRGTITQQISAYVTRGVFPLGDAFLDLHSGGSSLDILPSAIIEPTDDPGLRRRNIAAVLAFDAPLTVVIDNLGEPRTATAPAACRAGLVTVGTEMAGGGHGVDRRARHLPARRAQRARASRRAAAGGRLAAARRRQQSSSCPGSDAYVFATTDGVFEPFHAIGHAGVAPASRPAASTAPGTRRREPETLFYAADGIALRPPPARARAAGQLLPRRSRRRYEARAAVIGIDDIDAAREPHRAQ